MIANSVFNRLFKILLKRITFFIISISSFVSGADEVNSIIESIDTSAPQNAAIARKIWELAETSFKEKSSSKLLQHELAQQGFEIVPAVAGMPTAFTASYGQGKPVIVILAEFDALPGINQDATPFKKTLLDKHAGHACGHNLFAAGSFGAAVAVKDWLKQSGSSGTLRVYGTPAEEGGGGKSYFVSNGLLDDVDIALHWHPAAVNSASSYSTYAIISSKFEFKGYSAHAAAAPHHGRSALDGVEAFNNMVNLMREHVPEDTRMHYVITNGGKAPNVVPDKAEVHYFLRNPDSKVLMEIWGRVQQAAKGAAMGTGTEVDIKVDGGLYSLLPNDTLAVIADGHLKRVGGVIYNKQEQAFAEEISKTFYDQSKAISNSTIIAPFSLEGKVRSGSTDVGDVSWVVPTVGVATATWVPGTTPHSWQAVAASGHSIGFKGAQVAAKVMALTAVDLFKNPQLRKDAKAELNKRRGSKFEYRPLAGNGIAPTAQLNN